MAAKPGKHRTRLALATPATIVKFVSRADARRIRGQQNFGRFMMKTGPYTHPDPRERARLQHEQHEWEREDERWKLRHAPVPGGAVVVRFPDADVTSAPVEDIGSGF